MRGEKEKLRFTLDALAEQDPFQQVSSRCASCSKSAGCCVSAAGHTNREGEHEALQWIAERSGEQIIRKREAIFSELEEMARPEEDQATRKACKKVHQGHRVG